MANYVIILQLSTWLYLYLNINILLLLIWCLQLRSVCVWHLNLWASNHRYLLQWYYVMGLLSLSSVRL